MKTLLSACVVLALALPAAAQPRYDRKLEDAAKAILAARIGDIRGGFDLDERPVIVVMPETGAAGLPGFASTYDVRWATGHRAGFSTF